MLAAAARPAARFNGDPLQKSHAIEAPITVASSTSKMESVLMWTTSRGGGLRPFFRGRDAGIELGEVRLWVELEVRGVEAQGVTRGLAVGKKIEALGLEGAQVLRLHGGSGLDERQIEASANASLAKPASEPCRRAERCAAQRRKPKPSSVRVAHEVRCPVGECSRWSGLSVRSCSLSGDAPRSDQGASGDSEGPYARLRGRRFSSVKARPKVARRVPKKATIGMVRRRPCASAALRAVDRTWTMTRCF